MLRVPATALPEVVPSTGIAGHTDPAAFLGLELPIAGIAGDQQAALFGQACFSPGDAKCTYGTGSFVLANTGGTVARPGNGLLSTVAWMDGTGRLTYALEGSVFVTGAAIQWLRDGLGLLDDAAQSEALAAAVPDSGGVVFVPALTGLGAPDWDPDARGAIFGITRGTTRAHLVRATLEAIAYEVRDVFDVMVTGDWRAGARAAGRRRCQRQRPAHAATGRSAPGPGGAAGDHGDHRPGRGVPRRAGHRRVVVTPRNWPAPGGWASGSSRGPATTRDTSAGAARWSAPRAGPAADGAARR